MVAYSQQFLVGVSCVVSMVTIEVASLRSSLTLEEVQAKLKSVDAEVSCS